MPEETVAGPVAVKRTTAALTLMFSSCSILDIGTQREHPMAPWHVAREALTLVGYFLTLYVAALVGHGYGL